MLLNFLKIVPVTDKKKILKKYDSDFKQQEKYAERATGTKTVTNKNIV